MLLSFLETCVFFTSSLYVALENVFNTCSIVGYVLVASIVWFVKTIWSVFFNLWTLLGILCDDYSIFLSDLWTGLVVSGECVKTAVLIVSDGVGQAIEAILFTNKKILLYAIDGILSVYEIIAQIIRLIFGFIYLAYNSVSYVGVSVLSVVTNLPLNLKLGVLLFAEGTFVALKSFFDVIYQIRSSIIVAIATFIDYLKCFVYESTYSFLGFIIGLLICASLLLNIKNILLFFMATILAAFEGICLLVNNCWTGEFFYNQPRGPIRAEAIEVQRIEEYRERSQSVEELREDGLCTVCLNNPKNILYLPCRHVCVCQVCSGQIRSYCPMCRVRIRRKIQVYL